MSLTLAKTLNPDTGSDAEHLLTWDASANQDNKVRFLSPVEVYPPGSTAPSAASPTPKNYAQYVLSLAKGDAKITEVVKTTVDGRSATLMTLTSSGDPQPGSLGCPEHGNDQHEECFGIQPEYELRLAVMNSGPPLALWARTTSDNPDLEFLKSFEAMLKTVHFR